MRFESKQGQVIFFRLNNAHRLWGSPSLIFNGYRGGGGGGSGRGVKFSTHLHLVPKLRMSGALFLLHNTPS